MESRLREFINSNHFWSKMKISELSEVSPDTIYRFCKGEKKGKTVTDKILKACIGIGFQAFDFDEFVMLAKINGYTFDFFEEDANLKGYVQISVAGRDDVALFSKEKIKGIDFIQNDASIFHAVLSFSQSTIELKDRSLILKCFN